VTKVEIYAGGALQCTATAAPFACTWRPTGKNGSTRVLQARAYDAAGNVGASALITVRQVR
jgi:hypothetical protein